MRRSGKRTDAGFLFRGGTCAPSSILSFQVYNTCTVSKTGARCTPPMHSVYRLYPENRVCAGCLQTMCPVYKLCTVSICMDSGYRIYSGTCVCAQSLQIGAPCLHVCTENTYSYTRRHRLHRDRFSIPMYVYAFMCVYTCTRLRVHTCSCVRMSAYTSVDVHI